MVEDASRKSPWSFRELGALLKESAKEWLEDRTPRQAAALAYYALLALGPLLLVTISLVGFFVGEQTARDTIFSWLRGIVGADSARTVSEFVAGAGRERTSIWSALLGFFFVLLGAAGVFGQLKQALNTTWEVRRRPVEGFKAKVRVFFAENLVRFLAVLAVGALLLASIVASTVLATLSVHVGDVLPGGALLWQLASALVSVALLTLAFAGLYKWLPDVRLAWRDTWVGALVTAVLFVAGQLALGYYLGAGTFASRYGAAGAVVAVLVWVYYSGLIFFFGAELTQVYANRYGHHVHPEPDAERIQRAVHEVHEHPSKEGTDAKGKRAGRGAS